MKTIVSATLKGGTGKTSTLFNLAGVLGEKYNILLIDCDAQTNLSMNVGVDVTANNLKTIKEVFDGETSAEKVILKSPIKELPKVDIIPSSIQLTATELKIVSLAGRENILKNFILDNDKLLSKYDYIMIDTNPSMSIVNQNAFNVADSIILVSDISLNGIQGAELFIYLWGEVRKLLRKDNNIKALILNNYDRRIKLSSELLEFTLENEAIKYLVTKTYISNSVKIKETELEHKPINILHKNSEIHKTFLKIIDEFLSRGVL